MFRFIKAFRKWDKHHRGVSPVIAAILLIGLAVLAGAAVFFIVLPLLQGNVSIEFSSISATDANKDGLVDTIKLSFVNTGTVAGTISDVDLSAMTGWSVTDPSGGTFDVNPAASATVVTVRPGTVGDQITTGDSINIAVSVDGTVKFNIDEDTTATDSKSYASVATAKNVANADLVIDDYSYPENWVRSTNAGAVADGLVDANRQTGSGSPGLRFRTQNGEDVVFYQSTAGDPQSSYGAGTNSPSKITTWSKSDKPVVAFYMKTSDAITAGAAQNIWVYFEAYSGSTDLGAFTYNLENIVAGQPINQWFLVVIDLSDFTDTNWQNSYSATEQAAANVGGFGVRVDNNSVGQWDVYVDDVYIAESL